MEIQTTSIFLNNYSSKKKININRGGTRSGKTFNLLQLFLFWLLYGRVDDYTYFDKGILTVVRKYSSTLKSTTMRDFEEIIDMYSVRNKIEINKSDKTYKYKDRVVEFIGADDQQKLRGGKRDILYCNEANELQYRLEFFQLLIRTKYKVFIDFNPDDEYVWINTELEQKRRIEEKDVRVIVSTYKDNPYISAGEIKEIERLEFTDKAYWNIYGLGNYGKLEGLIYSFEQIDNIPKEANFICRGMDFGFTNDPTAVVDIYVSGDNLIVDEVLYQKGLTNSDIIEKFNDFGLDKKKDIYADSSEPKSIEEIHRGGYNIKPVTKGPDSIKFGIGIVNDYNIQITTSSPHIRKELLKYIWKLDKSGNALNEPVDRDNHALDAMRYAVMMTLNRKKKKTFKLINLN